MEAIKNKPRCASQCLEHVFELVNHNGNNKHNVRVTFCPKFRRDPYPPEKTIAEFNLDNRYYTQAFVLGTERKALTNNHHQDLMNFQTMTKDACEKNNQIVLIKKIQFFPKPNEKNSYCSVCKEHFQNYYLHIREESHRVKIDAAIYNTEIKRLCDFYKDLWPNSHTKADQIVRELMKQSEISKKGNKNQNEEQDSQQEESQNDELEEEQEQNQGDENENVEGQEEQYEQESEEVHGRKKKGLNQQHKAEVSQQQKKQKNQIASNKQNYTQKVIKQAKQYSKQLVQKLKITQTFFDHRPTQFVVFLKKNKQGEYRVIRDLDPMLKNGEFAEMDQDINQDSGPRDNRKINQRLPPKSNKEDKSRKYKKVRRPQPQAEDDQNQQDSSDFSLQKGKNGYSSLNTNNNPDRIRTRKEQKQDKKQSLNKQRQQQTYNKKQTPKELETANPRAYSYQMTPQMIEQLNAQRIQAHYSKTMGQNPQPMQKMPMIQGHMDPHTQQIPKMPMQGMQYPPMYFHHQPGQQPKVPVNGQVRISNPYTPRFYAPNMNMMGYNMPMGAPVLKPDEKKQKGLQQSFPQPQQMYYPPGSWGGYMMPQQMMRSDGIEQRGQMIPPMNYQMMQNPNKPPQTGMQPQGQKMGMYMPYPMDPRYGNPYGYAHNFPSPQQYLQKKPEPNKEPK